LHRILIYLPVVILCENLLLRLQAYAASSFCSDKVATSFSSGIGCLFSA
jgi:hypothetical protein